MCSQPCVAFALSPRFFILGVTWPDHSAKPRKWKGPNFRRSDLSVSHLVTTGFIYGSEAAKTVCCRRDGGRGRKNEAGNGSNFQLGKTLANSAEIVLRQTPYAKLINTFMHKSRNVTRGKQGLPFQW